MHRQVAIILGLPLLILASVAASAAAPENSADARKAAWDDYQILITRNIFSRDRSPQRPTQIAVPPPLPRPENPAFVLTGVTVCGEVRTAFFENNQTGETVQVSTGGTVGGGTVASISLDSVEYSSGGATRKIAVGENLAGVAGTLSGPAASTSQPAVSEAAASPGGAGNDSAKDIIERMRQRRLQETRQ